MEVFVDDFFVYGTSFGHCLDDFSKMLQRRKKVNLALNWEQCHFIVQEGMIEKLSQPTSVKSVRRFLRHIGFH